MPAHVVGLGEGSAHVEVVSPAGELKAVIAKRLGLGREIRNCQIRPLTSEQCDRSTHVPPKSDVECPLIAPEENVIFRRNPCQRRGYEGRHPRALIGNDYVANRNHEPPPDQLSARGRRGGIVHTRGPAAFGRAAVPLSAGARAGRRAWRTPAGANAHRRAAHRSWAGVLAGGARGRLARGASGRGGPHRAGCSGPSARAGDGDLPGRGPAAGRAGSVAPQPYRHRGLPARVPSSSRPP